MASANLLRPFGKSKPTRLELARGSPGKRCYAVGDIHGRLDLLEALLAKIEADNAARSRKETVLVLLGDLIDRGPCSSQVVERLLSRPPSFCRTLCLMGNHEETLVRGLSGEAELLPKWLKSGGFECAQSYGVEIGGLFGAADEIVERALLERIPGRHIEFMRTFVDSVRFGDYLLVHAGIRPGVPLEQMGRDVRWIREGFLDSRADFGFVVVHGHTICNDVEMLPNRIGIDTGAYQTGVLTAIRLEDAERELLQVRGDPAV